MSTGFLGVLSGLGERARERSQSMLALEMEKRRGLMEFWGGLITKPEWEPKRSLAVRNYLLIANAPFDKKLPKEVTGLDELLAPREGPPEMGPQAEVSRRPLTALAPPPEIAPPPGAEAMPAPQPEEVPLAPRQTAVPTVARLSTERPPWLTPEETTAGKMAEAEAVARAQSRVEEESLRRTVAAFKRLDPSMSSQEAIAYAVRFYPSIAAGKPIEVKGRLLDPTTLEVLYESPEEPGAAFDRYLGLKEQVEAGKLGKDRRDLTANEKLKIMSSARQEFSTADPEVTALRQDIMRLQLEQAKRLSGLQLTPAQFSMATSMSDDFLLRSKDFLVVRDFYDRLNEMGAKTMATGSVPTAAESLSLIFSYMKILDPASVVREGEQATAANARNAPEAIRSIYNRLLGTGAKLTVNQVRDFVQRSKDMYSAAANRQRQAERAFSARARGMGIPPDYVVMDLTVPVDRYGPVMLITLDDGREVKARQNLTTGEWEQEVE